MSYLTEQKTRIKLLTVNCVSLFEACAVYRILASDSTHVRNAALPLLRCVHVTLWFDHSSHLVLSVILAEVASR